jgi:gamma-glutamylcyclotransferase (GGCT)/AIG2-like uncharacterized protein YtfP
MLMNEPGQGCQVKGELYRVDESQLRLIDAIESVGERGNFRKPIEIEPIDDAAVD